MARGTAPKEGSGRYTKQFSKKHRFLAAAALAEGAEGSGSEEDEDFDGAAAGGAAGSGEEEDEVSDGEEGSDEGEEEAEPEAAAKKPAARKRAPAKKRRPGAEFVDDAAAEGSEDEEVRPSQPPTRRGGAPCGRCSSACAPNPKALRSLQEAEERGKPRKRARNAFIDDEVEVADEDEDDDDEDEDDREAIDDTDLGAARAEVEDRMHARMMQERQAGNEMNEEELNAMIKERCAPGRPTREGCGPSAHSPRFCDCCYCKP
jgi:hypothetical protein